MQYLNSTENKIPHQDHSSDDKPLSSPFNHDSTYIKPFEENNSETSINACLSDLSNIRLNAKSESSDLLYSYASSNSVLNNNDVEFMSTSNNAQEPLQHIFVPPPISLNVLGIMGY